MSDGSLQLRLYRRARRAGVSTEEAAARAGIGLVEAKLHDQDDAKNPPGEGCYRLTPGMARSYVGDLADTPLGASMIAQLTEQSNG